MKVAFAVLSGLFLALPALAQTGGTMTGSGAGLTVNNPDSDNSEGASDHDGRNANGEKLICRRINNDSSSRLRGSHRICNTAAQWRAIDRNRNN
jgi:hypothetical protein